MLMDESRQTNAFDDYTGRLSCVESAQFASTELTKKESECRVRVVHILP